MRDGGEKIYAVPKTAHSLWFNCARPGDQDGCAIPFSQGGILIASHTL